MAGAEDKRVIVGRISGLYGVRGWVRIFSYTEPRDNILKYGAWQVGKGERWRHEELAEGRIHGKGIVVRLAGYEDRDAASALVGHEVAIERGQLPEPEGGEYYWTDLEGLRVRTRTGVELGVVDHLFATGANDVLVVKNGRERLIPFVLGEVVTAVDLASGWLEVDWDPEF
ncbi:MAG: ribosome maturation factor RimM [Gammaproteobacteria bacterium]